MAAKWSRTLAANTGSPRSTPATVVELLTGPTYWEGADLSGPGRRRCRPSRIGSRGVGRTLGARGGPGRFGGVPRDKTCGDGLTPRAVEQLELLGLRPWLDEHIRYRGLRLHGFGGNLEVPWPGPSFGGTGSAVRRTELDDKIRQVAVDSGAKMAESTKAVDVERDSAGRITSVRVLDDNGPGEIACKAVIVADGVRSTLGKILGREWHKDTVYAVAGRAYIESARGDEEWMTSHLELRSPR